MRILLRDTLRSVSSVLFPAPCRLCHAPLQDLSRLPVCAPCLDSIAPVEGPLCACCGEVVEVGASLCSRCVEERPAFRQAAAWGDYDGRLRDLIHLFKYAGVQTAVRPLARMTAGAVERLSFDLEGATPREVLAVPVPLHRSRRRERGFSQTDLLAQEMVRLLNRDRSGPRFRLLAGALVRSRPTVSQTGLGREQRQQNVRRAFAVRRPEELAGRAVLLVDDVFTTGATAAECARVLMRAGAGAVWVATSARVQPHRGAAWDEAGPSWAVEASNGFSSDAGDPASTGLQAYETALRAE